MERDVSTETNLMRSVQSVRKEGSQERSGPGKRGNSFKGRLWRSEQWENQKTKHSVRDFEQVTPRNDGGGRGQNTDAQGKGKRWERNPYKRRNIIERFERLLGTGKLVEAKKIIYTMEKSPTATRTLAHIVFLLGRSAGVEAAVYAFGCVKHANWMQGTCGKPILDAMVRVMAEHGREQDAQFYVKEMEKRDMPQTTYTMNSLLKAHALNRNSEKALEILEEMKTKSLMMNTETFNELLSMYLEDGNEGEVFKKFEEMFKLGVEPNSTTYEILMKIFFNRRDFAAAEPLFQSLLDSPQPMESTPFLYMMRLRLLSGNAAGVLECHEEMKRRKFRLTVLSYRLLRRACETATDRSVAERLLREVIGLKLFGELPLNERGEDFDEGEGNITVDGIPLHRDKSPEEESFIITPEEVCKYNLPKLVRRVMKL